MPFTSADLLGLLHLEPLEHNLFRGLSRDLGTGRIFGGQVLAQALVAARRTVEDERPAHSLHGYFVLPGTWRSRSSTSSIAPETGKASRPAA